MSSVTNRLVFIPTEIDSSSSVGAYVRAGTDGDLIGSQTLASQEWLNVASILMDKTGVAIDNTNPLPVSITSGLNVEVDLSHTEDSIALGNGTNLLTSHTVGSDIGLDVYLINSSISVTATDLDIRNLSASQDSIAISDGTDVLNINSDGSLNVTLANSDLANSAIENTKTLVSTTAVNVVSSPLTGRKWLALANEGNKTLYVGKNGVTTSDGFPLHPGMQMLLRVGSGVVVQAIGKTGASNEDLRVLELA